MTWILSQHKTLVIVFRDLFAFRGVFRDSAGVEHEGGFAFRFVHGLILIVDYLLREAISRNLKAVQSNRENLGCRSIPARAQVLGF